MISAASNPRIVYMFVSVFISFFLLISKPLSAEAPTNANDLSGKLSILESKISHLVSTQNQIVEKKSEIEKELATLRIWIRRNRS